MQVNILIHDKPFSATLVEKQAHWPTMFALLLAIRDSSGIR
jgi:hypothetical protein